MRPPSPGVQRSLSPQAPAQTSPVLEVVALNCSGLNCPPGEGNGNPLQCSCLENPRDGGAWWAAVYGIAQSRKQHSIAFPLVAETVKRLPTMQKTRVRSLGREGPLEKETATHSTTLAWKIPWMEERGRLQPMGLQRVRHN